MSFVARAHGELIGAVLCGTDGRRGYLHHLAVRTDWRGKGVGGNLVKRCLTGLLQAGIDRCHLFVYKENEAGRAFWVHQGWRERLDLMIASIDV
jgi:putative acetyltransferase